jgi:dephospho-CoA kinase
MGKSTVASMFRDAGAFVIRTDEIVHEILNDPVVVKDIRDAFGEDVVAGGFVNKQMLADIVFQHPHLRISLEDILHPRVFKRVQEIISEIPCDGSPCIAVVEAPILFERGYQNRFDKIVTVSTPEDVAVNRLLSRGISEQDAQRRLKTQFPVEIKARGSDYVIDNSGDLEATRRQVETIFEDLTALERRHGNN